MPSAVDELAVAGDDVGAAPDCGSSPPCPAGATRCCWRQSRTAPRAPCSRGTSSCTTPPSLTVCGRVDGDGLAVLLHLLAPERPEHGSRRGDRVVVLADGDPDRVPHLLQLLADRVEVFPGVGDLEAGLLEQVLPIGGHEEGAILRHRAPDPLDHGGLLGRRERRPVLLLELPHHVGHVHELRLVEPREVHAHLDEVVAGLCLHLGGVLGGLLGVPAMWSMSDLDAGVLGEALADLGQLLVRGGSEVVPAEVGNLPLLAARGRDAGRENAGEAAGRGQEAAAADLVPWAPPGGWSSWLMPCGCKRPDALAVHWRGRSRASKGYP